ncbi:MAG: hypothetical protein WBD40_00200 [Tepidisphaeraceae bacterium]
MMKKNIRHYIAGAAVIGALGVAAVATAAQQDTPDPVVVQKEPTKALAADAAKNLAVFSTARGAADQLPVAAVQYLAEINPSGSNPELARRATSSGNETLYLVPAADRVCAALVAPDGSSFTTCNYADAVARAASGPSVSVQGDVVTLLGVIPDSVSGVTVVFGDGTKKDLGIENNAYITRLSTADDIDAVEYTTAGDVARFDVTVPDLAAITAREKAAEAR